MDSSSETKNLVIIYQKLFNVASKRHRIKNKQSKKQKVNIRGCSSLASFRKALMQYQDIRKIMEKMCDSGEMLRILLKWKGKYSNLAIALKYFNVLVNMIKSPESVTNWKNYTRVKSQEKKSTKKNQLIEIKLEQGNQMDIQTLPSFEKKHSILQKLVHPCGLADIHIRNTGSSHIWPQNWQRQMSFDQILNHFPMPQAFDSRSFSKDSMLKFSFRSNHSQRSLRKR